MDFPFGPNGETALDYFEQFLSGVEHPSFVGQASGIQAQTSVRGARRREVGHVDEATDFLHVSPEGPRARSAERASSPGRGHRVGL